MTKWPYIFFIKSANPGGCGAGGGPGRMTSVAVTLARWAARLEPEPGDLELARPVLAGHGGGHAGRPRPSRHPAGRGPARGRALGRRRARAGFRRPAHAVDHARQRGLRADGAGHRRRAARLPGRGGGDGAAGDGPGLAALLGRLARHLHGRGAGQRRRGGRRAGAAGGADRGGHGAGRARRRRGPAGLRHGRQVAAGRLRRRRRDPRGPARGRGRAGRPRGAGRVAGPGRRRRPAAVDPSGPAVPNGLAIKLYPCCYALQRPISALSELAQSDLPGRSWTRPGSAGSCCAPRRPRSCR